MSRIRELGKVGLLVTAVGVGGVAAGRASVDFSEVNAGGGLTTPHTLQMQDSDSNRYNVVVGEGLVGITNDSKTSFSTTGAMEVTATIDEVCDGDGTPTIATKTGEIDIFLSVQPGCADALLQQGLAVAPENTTV